jgi:hypothetical protein
MCPAAAVPGLYREDFVAPVPPALRTGVPAFLGYAGPGPAGEPVELARAADFGARFPASPADGYLAGAVGAFFRNGGERCWVVALGEAEGAPAGLAALRQGLAAIEPLESVDLVCAPDAMRRVVALQLREKPPVTEDERRSARAAAVAMQRELLLHCVRAGDRMALLDAFPGDSPSQALEQARALAWCPAGAAPGEPAPAEVLNGANAALYYPWLRVDGAGPVPPCGHVAGVYARSDARTGVHKAPANEPLEGVLDVEPAVDDAAQGTLNPQGVNCIRAFPGRGVRVWGARTLSCDPAWRYVSVRRVFLTLGRWIALNLSGAAFEPSTPVLWARIGREAGAYLGELHRRGALRGRTPAEAFYVRCDADTNPPGARAAGIVVTEIGLAATAPGEFVVVRFTHGPAGVRLAGPA